MQREEYLEPFNTSESAQTHLIPTVNWGSESWGLPCTACSDPGRWKDGWIAALAAEHPSPRLTPCFAGGAGDARPPPSLGRAHLCSLADGPFGRTQMEHSSVRPCPSMGVHPSNKSQGHLTAPPRLSPHAWGLCCLQMDAIKLILQWDNNCCFLSSATRPRKPPLS